MIWLIETLSEKPQGLTYREIKDRWDRSRNMKMEVNYRKYCYDESKE